MKRRILLYRDYQGFTGGHLKVWDYFNHIRQAPGFEPLIAFAPNSHWTADNPWQSWREQIVPWQPEAADILFLAGLDWQQLPPAQRINPPRPVINLIQGVRHADPQQPLYDFLRHPALRICVSTPIAEALTATGQVNGPLVVIPLGIDLTELPTPPPWTARHLDLLIVGSKQPTLARTLGERLHAPGRQIEIVTTPLPRQQFLQRLSMARIALCLPLAAEGFYLPPLEAMALGTLVICPDCIGNRDYCQPGSNCLQPAYDPAALMAAAEAALALSAEAAERLQLAGGATAATRTLARERAALLDVLHQYDTV